MVNTQIQYIKGNELRNLQLRLLECLLEVDRVCRKNDIKYVIGFGTLLGAVRHKGFIPWDDDVDVCMTREEYDKFVKISNQLNPNICFFQDNSTEKEYPWGYGKVRRANTTYIRYGQEHLKHRTGLMIDIFPMDDIPNSLLGMRLFQKISFLLRKMTYAHIGYKTEKNVFLKIWYKLLSFVPTRLIHRFSKLFQTKFNNNTPSRAHMLFFPPDGLNVVSNLPEERYGWSKDWLLKREEYEFEGHKFFGPKDFNSCLSWSYGFDYMTPPSTSERESHAPCSFYDLGYDKFYI